MESREWISPGQGWRLGDKHGEFLCEAPSEGKILEPKEVERRERKRKKGKMRGLYPRGKLPAWKNEIPLKAEAPWR